MKENVSLKLHREGCIRFYQECKEGIQAYLELDGKECRCSGKILILIL